MNTRTIEHLQKAAHAATMLVDDLRRANAAVCDDDDDQLWVMVLLDTIQASADLQTRVTRLAEIAEEEEGKR